MVRSDDQLAIKTVTTATPKGRPETTAEIVGDRPEAFWTVVPDVRALEEYVPRSELNVAYVPVKAVPGTSVTAVPRSGCFAIRRNGTTKNMPAMIRSP